MPHDPIAQADLLISRGQIDAAIALVMQAAGQGDATALLRVAMWHLGGSILPRDLQQARSFLRRAVLAGDIDAALIEVALTANGSGAAPDWPLAVRLLEAAASRDAVAREHLDLVQHMTLRANGTPRNCPDPKVLHHGRPRVVHFPGLVSERERLHIAQLALPMLAPATVVDPITGRNVSNPIRTSDGMVMSPTLESLPIQAINKRLAAISRTDWQQGEALTVLRYQPGQEFRPHLDAIAGARNQRVRTILIYLNDSFEGGATRFTFANWAVRPRAGDAIMFDNIAPDGTIDTHVQHAGEEVTRGTKWLATRWIRARAFDPWTGPEAA